MTQRLAKLSGVLVCLVIALAAFAAPGALAAETREPTGLSFGPDGVGGSEAFGLVVGLGVDQSNGNVYVLDSGNGNLYKFNAAGEPSNFSATGSNIIEGATPGGGTAGLGETQIAVVPAGAPAGTAGNIYLAASVLGLVKVFAPSGAQIGTLGEGHTCGVATDPGGNVYVGEYPGEISKYVPQSNPPRDTDLTQTAKSENEVCNVAVDGLGQIYDLSFNRYGSLEKFSSISDPNPSFPGISGGSPTILNPSNHLLLLNNEGFSATEYGTSTEELLHFGLTFLNHASKMGAYGAQNKVYVASRVESGSESSNKVFIFGPPVVVPGLTVVSPTNVKTHSATLRGLVNPSGLAVTNCEFELLEGYEGEETTLQSVPCEGALPTDENDHPVEATVTGLEANREYSARLIATNANGKNVASGRFSARGVANADPATDVTASSATLNGTVVPEGEAVTECFFEYGIERAFDLTAPCAGATPGDDGIHPVTAAVSGLSRERTYYVRLVVKRASGESVSYENSFETAGASSFAYYETAKHITTSEATLQARLNPRGSQTSYYFEYGTSSSYGQKTPTVTLGSGDKEEDVAETLSGLQGATTYHWRIVVTDSFGTVEHPDHVFTTQLPPPAIEGSCGNQEFRGGFAAFLPDCRAYEQASPPTKNGNNVEGLASFMHASEDGENVSWFSQAITGTPASGGGHQEWLAYLSSRGGDNWSSQRLMPPASTGNKAFAMGTTANLRYAFYEAHQEFSQDTGLYMVDNENETTTTIVPPTPFPTEEGNFAFDGVSADGSHVYFETRAQLTPNAAKFQGNLYGWTKEGGITLVGVLPGPGEEAPESGSFGGPYGWWKACYECTEVGGSLANVYVEALHAISPSGDQVYFTAGFTGQLYLRRGLDGGNPTTVRVSAPEAGVVESERRPAAFQEATPDGKRAFFLSEERLTSDSTAGPGLDLYVWNESSETLRDITPDTADPSGARVQGLLGASKDGKSGYFAARGKLAEGATAGEMNLYRFLEKGDGSFEYVYVTALAPSNEEGSPNDRRNWSNTQGFAENRPGPPSKTSRVTPDGQTLLFSSVRSLTGYDNRAVVSENQPGDQFALAQEIYRYSASDKALICVSCNPTGERPKQSAELSTPFVNTYLEPGGHEHADLTRNLSMDGNRIFFQTPDPLVSSDVNGRQSCRFYADFAGNAPQCEDVYEWEAVGTPGGSCHREEVNGGCLYLMSTGQSAQPSNIIDSSADGKTVFIATTSALVPQDQDQLIDAYAVRTDGGLASQYAGLVKCSSGEACAGPAAVAPPPAARGTSTFSGPGNPKPKSKPGKCTKKGKGKKQCKKHKKGKGKKHKKGKKKGGHKRPAANSKKSGGSK